MKQNNKGFSLVEMLIVIAVLSLISVGSASAINYIVYANSEKCATQVNSMLDKARLQSMSKSGNMTLYLYRYNDKNYMKLSKEATPVLNDTGTRISGSQIKMYYTLSGTPSVQHEITNNTTNIMKIQYVKNSGGLKPVSGTDYYNSIVFKKSSGEEDHKITLIAITGKHFLD